MNEFQLYATFLLFLKFFGQPSDPCMNPTVELMSVGIFYKTTSRQNTLLKLGRLFGWIERVDSCN